MYSARVSPPDSVNASTMLHPLLRTVQPPVRFACKLIRSPSAKRGVISIYSGLTNPEAVIGRLASAMRHAGWRVNSVRTPHAFNASGPYETIMGT